jgi:hypothetical protein
MNAGGGNGSRNCAAAARDPSQRADVLAGVDLELRRELEAALAQEETAEVTQTAAGATHYGRGRARITAT